LLIRCRWNVFIESLPSNEQLLWLRYSGFQASCHIVIYSMSSSALCNIANTCVFMILHQFCLLPAFGLQVKVKVNLQLTVSQSVCLGVEPHLGLTTKYFFIYLLLKLRSCQFWAALSDERTGLSFVNQSLEVSRLSVYTYKQKL
jgi:hypothetical protein